MERGGARLPVHAKQTPRNSTATPLPTPAPAARRGAPTHGPLRAGASGVRSITACSRAAAARAATTSPISGPDWPSTSAPNSTDTNVLTTSPPLKQPGVEGAPRHAGLAARDWMMNWAPAQVPTPYMA